MVYYRRNLLVLSLTTFLATCGWNQVVPFLPLFIKELGVKGGVAFWAGVVLAAQTVTMIVMLLYWGKLADKYGARLMTIRAGICLALIYLGMSYCQNVWQLLLLRVLNGALTGFTPASVTLVATNTPKHEAARYVAIIQSAIALGAIAGPSVGSILAGWAGYRGSMLVSCMIVTVAVLLVYLLVEERQKVVNNSSTSMWQDFRLALQKPVLVTGLCSNMTHGFVTTACQPILILYIQELTGTNANLFTGPIFSLPGLAVLLTNYYWCRLGERHTFQKIILLGLTGTGIFTLIQGLVENIWWFATTYLLAGLCAAAVSPNTAALIATRVEADFQGRAFALQQSSRFFGCFLAPLLAGSLGSILSLVWIFVIVGLLDLAATFVLQLQIQASKNSQVVSVPM